MKRGIQIVQQLLVPGRTGGHAHQGAVIFVLVVHGVPERLGELTVCFIVVGAAQLFQVFLHHMSQGVVDQNIGAGFDEFDLHRGSRHLSGAMGDVIDPLVKILGLGQLGGTH